MGEFRSWPARRLTPPRWENSGLLWNRRAQGRFRASLESAHRPSARPRRSAAYGAVATLLHFSIGRVYPIEKWSKVATAPYAALRRGRPDRRSFDTAASL